MLLQTNSYIVPKERRAEHARLIRRFRQALARIGCDQFEVYEQVGANWSPDGANGRYVQIMRFRDRHHQLSVQAAEREDEGAQTIIAEFCELINFPYQQQHGYFATGFYTSVLPVGPRQAATINAPLTDEASTEEYPADEETEAAVEAGTETVAEAGEWQETESPAGGEETPMEELAAGEEYAGATEATTQPADAAFNELPTEPVVDSAMEVPLPSELAGEVSTLPRATEGHSEHSSETEPHLTDASMATAPDADLLVEEAELAASGLEDLPPAAGSPKAPDNFIAEQPVASEETADFDAFGLDFEKIEAASDQNKDSAHGVEAEPVGLSFDEHEAPTPVSPEGAISAPGPIALEFDVPELPEAETAGLDNRADLSEAATPTQAAGQTPTDVPPPIPASVDTSATEDSLEELPILPDLPEPGDEEFHLDEGLVFEGDADMGSLLDDANMPGNAPQSENGNAHEEKAPHESDPELVEFHNYLRELDKEGKH